MTLHAATAPSTVDSTFKESTFPETVHQAHKRADHVTATSQEVGRLSSPSLQGYSRRDTARNAETKVSAVRA